MPSEMSVAAGNREIVLTREIDAPRELVFSLWTEPEHLLKWWGPHDCSAPSVSVDLQEGGAWRNCILAPDGKEYWSHGRYIEIEPPRRLVFTFAWENEAGEPEHEMLATVELEDKNGRTLLTFRKRELPDDKELKLQAGGWAEALDKVAAYAAAAAKGRNA
ncbi:SRPBCC domain-containing protein [Rhizobium sp. BK251]|uniref:SRPBCC family protein n=1 Tax=Rhizobium sp. BK251 TaxID=2512125 RepID=UPI0010502D77|nr:SRPBCC domain-containing protein [Rhizobium sp. BK251]TCL72161.1 uncharacterized protein YndB with AHSA1/START domain [Rhizobium sp. BK251]